MALAGADLEKPLKTIPVVRETVAPPPEPKLEGDAGLQARFEGCSWVWYPEGDPAQSAPAGACYFRKQFTLPADRKPAKAVFFGTADNNFVLYLNGQEAGHGDDSGEGWRNPVELEVGARLKPGLNQLAIRAVNATDKPSPAGVLGCLQIEFDAGAPLRVPVDATWRVAREAGPGWTQAGFDDARWPQAKVAALFGGAPWGRPGAAQLTLSPVKANPFFGSCELPASLDLRQSRVYLQLEGLAPEAAARVTINGKDAGGFIGLPLRLSVTPFLQPGRNRIQIEPFAPATARLAVFTP